MINHLASGFLEEGKGTRQEPEPLGGILLAGREDCSPGLGGGKEGRRHEVPAPITAQAVCHGQHRK